MTTDDKSKTGKDAGPAPAPVPQPAYWHSHEHQHTLADPPDPLHRRVPRSYMHVEPHQHSHSHELPAILPDDDPVHIHWRDGAHDTEARRLIEEHTQG